MNKIYLIIIAGIICLFSSILYAVYRENKEVVQELTNQLNNRDQTIELAKGIFYRVTEEKDNLEKKFLNENQELKNEIKKKNQEIQAINQVAISWRNDFTVSDTARRYPVSPLNPGGKERIRIEFSKNFGTISASGYTITDPDEYTLKIHQERPWDINLVLTQDSLGAWQTYATSSDENIKIDIKSATVNAYIRKKHWYEKLSVNSSIVANLENLLLGVGVGYDVDKYNISGIVFANPSDKSYSIGTNISWHPFRRIEQ